MIVDEKGIVDRLKALVHASPSIRGVVVLAPDGLEIAKFYKETHEELEALDILGVEIQKYGDRMVRDYQNEKTEFVLLKMTNSIILIYTIGDEALLSIQASATLNLNWAMLNIPKVINSLKELL